jgi:DNA-binding IclR family transcriptional regulator
MSGSKSEKRTRIEKLAALVALAPQGLTQAALAHMLSVAPSTIADDLVTLERLGVLLAEDEQGRLTLLAHRSGRYAPQSMARRQRFQTRQ